MSTLSLLITAFSLMESLHAQEAGFLSPTVTDKVTLSYEHDFSDIETSRASFSVPVMNDTESGLAFIGRGQRVKTEDQVTFEESGAKIPEEFGTADFGFSYKQEDLRGHQVGVQATYGAAGTRLFNRSHAPVLSATVMAERKHVDHSWYYFLAYSNNRTTLNGIPLPGFAYAVNRKEYTAVFGLPFVFFNWRPDPFSFSTALSPFGASVDGGIRFLYVLNFYVSANWSPRAYQNLVDGRDDRLIYDKREVGAGLRMNLSREVGFSVGFIHVSGRRFMLGKSVTDEDAETENLKDGSGVKFSARFAF